jgi:hypothetical protein
MCFSKETLNESKSIYIFAQFMKSPIPNLDDLSRSQRSGLRLVDPTARREIPLAGLQRSVNPDTIFCHKMHKNDL